ncbi:MAG TPA: PilZ domain-containing protein [Allosphingosinicella sp.]|nr:PilZ domain-containing protein [Allosphingosinicella sp.]
MSYAPMSSVPLSAIPPAIANERRRTRRIEVMLPVEIEMNGERRVARITEMSRAGARLTLRGPTTTNSVLTIRRNGVELHAVIVWADDTQAGVWFPQPMDEGSFLQLRKRVVS